MTIQKNTPEILWEIKATRRQVENVFKHLTSLNEEITLQVKEDGIRVEVVNGQHTSMMTLFWPNSAFEQYAMDDWNRFTIADGNDIIHSMKTVGLNDLVVLKYDDLGLHIHTDYQKTNIKPYENPSQGPKLPDFSGLKMMEVEAPVKWFKEAINGIGRKTNLAEFIVNDESLIIKAADLAQKEVWEYEWKHGKTFGSKDNFPSTILDLNQIKRLAGHVNAAKVEKITMNIGNRMPLDAYWTLRDGAEIRFILAPRLNGN